MVTFTTSPESLSIVLEITKRSRAQLCDAINALMSVEMDLITVETVCCFEVCTTRSMFYKKPFIRNTSQNSG